VSLGFVWWEEDPERKREVVRLCKTCERSVRVYNYNPKNWLRSLDDVTIVSPSGIGHVQHWEGDERTRCGAYAAGEDWWWRL